MLKPELLEVLALVHFRWFYYWQLLRNLGLRLRAFHDLPNNLLLEQLDSLLGDTLRLHEHLCLLLNQRPLLLTEPAAHLLNEHLLDILLMSRSLEIHLY